jgi:surface protein
MYERVLFYIAKGSAPWASSFWYDNSHIIMVDDAIHGQAEVITDDKVTNMNCMFYNCKSLIALNLSTYYTFNVTSMRSMFNGCCGLTTLDLSNFDTSKVEDMTYMFANCSNLTSINLSSFNTSNVTNMRCMLCGCSSLTTLDLSNFDTSNVKNMYAMFYNCSNLTTIKGVIDMKSCEDYEDMFKWCTKLKNVKIKNPPDDFESSSGLSKSQYTIVDDESNSLKRRNNMFRTTGIEPIIDIYRAPGFSTEKISINYIPADANNDAPKYDKATQEFDGEKEKDNKEAMSDFNKAVKELSNKLNEIVGKNTEESSPKEEVSKETKAEDHKHTNEEKVQETINKQRPNSNKYNKLYYILTEFIYQRDFIPAFLWFMEHAYNNVLITHQHKRRSYKIYKEIVKGGNLIGKCNISESDIQHCYFVLDGSNRSLNDYNYNRQRKAAKLLAKYIIASNTVPYVLNLKYYLENFGDPYSDYAPTGTSSVMKRTFTDVYVETLEKVCFGKDF